MKYIDFKNNLKEFSVFSLSDIATITSRFHRKQLTEWIQKGYIQKLKRGYYYFLDSNVNDMFLYIVANKIYEPSYISMELALSRYEFIPESVYSITSITTRKTQTIKTPVGQFIYKNIKPELMFGYQLEDSGQLSYKFATPEKALLDFFYYNNSLSTISDIEEMRFNTQEINEKINWETFQKFLVAFNSTQLKKRITLFKEYIRNA